MKKTGEDMGDFEGTMYPFSTFSLMNLSSDAELRLDATRDDDLNDLEDGEVERWRAHTKTARDWPNRPRLA